MAVEGSVPAEGAIVPHLIVADTVAAVDFYERAFAATVLYRAPSPSGKGEHIHLKIWSPRSYCKHERKMTMKWIGLLTLLGASCLYAQSSEKTDDPFQSLHFLEGTWSASTPGKAGAPNVVGSYSFKKELGGHILARHSNSDACKGPADFDCDHGDLLYIYPDGPAQVLKAIYFDNEGHVIHYTVTAPTPASVIFSSDKSEHAPQFQLVYVLKDSVMSGKFQMQMPGQTDWKSYLEWSGQKK